ncbi:MAG: hypothetical protein MUO27_05875, partial [Sedimentisphaerales bacterium]|nr:hypothetical protein [Sedimentisphaerales bacterium]
MKSKEKTKSNQPASRNYAGAISRRSFLVAGLAVPLIIPRHVLGGDGNPAPSEKLSIAVVGVGGMGRNYIEGCRGEQIV